MAYGSGAWQNDPRVANKESNDKNGFDRMMQLAAVASMMDNKTALGFGLGSIIANYLAKQRAAKADALAYGQQAAASVFGQTPQGAAGATVSAPTTLTLTNPAGAQQYQWPTVDTDWLHKNS